MICKLKQTKTNFNMQWSVLYNDNQICEIKSPFETDCFNAYFHFANSEQYRMYYNPFDKTFGKRMEDRLSFKLFDSSDNLIGKFVSRTHKTGKLFSGYAYFELNFKDRQYIGYEVGLGADGIALCLYYNDTMVALIDKNTKVVNFCDEYAMYLSDESLLSIAALYAVYYDMLKFANIGEVKLFSETQTYLITHNKELKEKYDPDFIQQIKSMDGIQN